MFFTIIIIAVCFFLVCLLCNSCGASVHVSSDVHVDVDGGRCPICVTGKGFY